MKNIYAISIPKPCHENWNTMTPKEKGRFCDSCAKTVIDFTKMDIVEIQDFIHQNKESRICGHFKQTQLDSINLFIPSKVIESQKNFHKLFLLVLLIVMGTTLFNCTNKNGNQQKIDSVEIIDSINNHSNNITLGLPIHNEIDSIPLPKCSKNLNEQSSKEKKIIEESLLIVDGMLEIETLGDIEIVEPVGILIYEEEEEEDDMILGFITVDSPPEFKSTTQNLNIQEKRNYFSDKITEIVFKNFNTSVCLDVTGKQKIFTQFKIDEQGKVVDIKVRAPHPKLEQEAKRVIELLPQFIPARQRSKPITVVYDLPIVFQVEE